LYGGKPGEQDEDEEERGEEEEEEVEVKVCWTGSDTSHESWALNVGIFLRVHEPTFFQASLDVRKFETRGVQTVYGEGPYSRYCGLVRGLNVQKRSQ
jgi:hypothetical protein